MENNRIINTINLVGDYSVIDLLVIQERQKSEWLKENLQLKAEELESRINNRIDKEEKISYLKEVINTQREKLEKDNLLGLNKNLNKPLREVLTSNLKYVEGVASIVNGFSNVPDILKNGFIPQLLGDIKTGEENLNISEVVSFIEGASSMGVGGDLILNAAKSEDPKEAMVTAVLILHYEQLWLEFLIEEVKRMKEEKHEASEPLKGATIAQQVLAVHYLLDAVDVNGKTDKTEVARFIQMLTGKELGAAKIADTSIYKKVKKPLAENDKQAEEDLRFIRPYFEKLGLKSIVAKINKEIGSKE